MATTRSREELAKAYAIKTLEMSRATLMVTMGPSAGRIINQIDWDLVATPLTALLLGLRSAFSQSKMTLDPDALMCSTPVRSKNHASC